jgi:signal transduction histidine kinase
VVLLLAAYRPPLAVTFILITSFLGMLVFSSITGYRRSAARRHQQLEQAFDAANKVADESIQAALTTTLLTLGHFLHELRNYQTAVSSNLEYIAINATLSTATRGALEEARLAQGKQEQLVRATVDDLRARSSPTNETFALSSALSRAAANASDARVVVSAINFDVDITGNPEHLGVVLLNLVRNAEQAGATTIRINAQPEPSGHAVQIAVEDDGPGLDASSRGRLFDSFAVSAKPGGSGLGLYLVSRYTQLLGGRVEAVPSKSGGAAFLIRLPGHVRTVADTSRT